MHAVYDPRKEIRGPLTSSYFMRCLKMTFLNYWFLDVFSRNRRKITVIEFENTEMTNIKIVIF